MNVRIQPALSDIDNLSSETLESVLIDRNDSYFICCSRKSSLRNLKIEINGHDAVLHKSTYEPLTTSWLWDSSHRYQLAIDIHTSDSHLAGDLSATSLDVSRPILKEVQFINIVFGQSINFHHGIHSWQKRSISLGT